MISIRIAIGTIALICSPVMLQAATADSPLNGVWASDFGDIRLSEKQGEVSGSYVTDDGRIIGTFDGAVIEGFWVETASDYTCETTKLGSAHWGRVRFELNRAGTGWTGIWSHCDYEYVPGAVWNARRK